MGKLIDITNQKFGRLTVLKKSDKRNAAGQVYWDCQCDCGNKCTVSGTALRTGHTKSCGCYNLEKVAERGHNKLEDLTNQHFGKLTVLYRSPNHVQESGQVKTTWHCKCECGNECDVTALALKNGKTKSCGCIRISYGEELIAKILKQNNLNFIQEYKFDSCILPSGKLARFDFYVNNEYLIEFDGKQHFIQEAGWNEPLEDIQKRDNFKNNWCKNNNILLYRIPYYDIDNITTLNDILQSKYLI